MKTTVIKVKSFDFNPPIIEAKKVTIDFRELREQLYKECESSFNPKKYFF